MEDLLKKSGPIFYSSRDTIYNRDLRASPATLLGYEAWKKKAAAAAKLDLPLEVILSPSRRKEMVKTRQREYIVARAEELTCHSQPFLKCFSTTRSGEPETIGGQYSKTVRK
jgi:hypothetical protein